MSDRNKSFRGHCNIDVLIDRESNSVSVELSYKPELLVPPLVRECYRYNHVDVVEELKRQGLSVGEAVTGRHLELNNTTFGTRREYLQASYVFPLATNKPSPTFVPKPQPVLQVPESPAKKEVQVFASPPIAEVTQETEATIKAPTISTKKSAKKRRSQKKNN